MECQNDEGSSNETSFEHQMNQAIETASTAIPAEANVWRNLIKKEFQLLETTEPYLSIGSLEESTVIMSITHENNMVTNKTKTNKNKTETATQRKRRLEKVKEKYRTKRAKKSEGESHNRLHTRREHLASETQSNRERQREFLASETPEKNEARLNNQLCVAGYATQQRGAESQLQTFENAINTHCVYTTVSVDRLFCVPKISLESLKDYLLCIQNLQGQVGIVVVTERMENLSITREFTISRKVYSALRWLTLDEIAEELEAGEDPGDIILFPPDDGVVTDEDSGDENEANILHLSSRMLRSQVEIQNRPSISGDNCLDNLEEEEEVEVPAPKKKKKIL
ncbi:hypothetical protein EVAR_52338_1 [Eumeta japonica]|uniref:Uncharacterized protein n=1 Tax=Eumeta variegata TaxID=151549 RepID=A0A4C1Y6X7_EUMVA|nr:hypothetical protein EVAR_52338_1 [Eumeta japonica]